MANSDDYKQQLIRLQPQGIAWPTEYNSNWLKLLDAISQELARVDSRINDLVNESYPDTATEALPEWEYDHGLPNECAGLGSTIAIRRMDLLTKMTTLGGQSRQYYIDVAARLGYTITITEFDMFEVGRNVCGDPLNSDDWQQVWRINSSLVTVNYFYAGANSSGDNLSTFGNQRLECFLNQIKPAHTILFFGYS